MGIQINGNTNNINAGIGSLSIEDINELDIIGVATAANFKTGVSNLHNLGLTLSGGQLDVGSNIKIGNAGVITATSFVGSGANLTGITQTTINNNANNRLITGSGTANTLEGESNLTFNGNTLNISGSSDDGRVSIVGHEGYDARLSLIADQGDDHIDQWNIRSKASNNTLTIDQFGGGTFNTRLTIASDANNGDVTINTGNLIIPDSIIHNGDTNTKIRFPAADTISMEVAGSEVFKIVPDAAHGSSQSIRLRTTHTIDGAAVNMGGTKAYSAGIIRGLVNIRDGNAYNVTDNGGGLGFSAIYNSGGSHTTMSQIEGVKANNTDGNYEGAIKFATRHNLGNMVEKARIGLNGLSFQGDTAAANCLDDYEEGTWTPTVIRSSAGYSGSYNAQVGIYTKIGRLVHLAFSVDIQNFSGGGGHVGLAGLPFSVGGNGLPGWPHSAHLYMCYLDAEYGAGVDARSIIFTGTNYGYVWNTDDGTWDYGNYSRIKFRGQFTYMV